MVIGLHNTVLKLQNDSNFPGTTCINYISFIPGALPTSTEDYCSEKRLMCQQLATAVILSQNRSYICALLRSLYGDWAHS